MESQVPAIPRPGNKTYRSSHRSFGVLPAVFIGAPGNRRLFFVDKSSCTTSADHLIDRLSRRLGADHVVQPHLQADSQPERAYYNASWITHLPQQKHSQQTSCSTAQPLIAPGTRPLQLLSPPPRLAVTAIAFDGPPVRFKYRQHSYHVEQSWGPERIETGWWRGPVIRRDYYRVQTMTGHRFWLFRELQHNDWYLHGHFS